MMIQRFVERNYKLLEPSINQLENVLGSQFKHKTIEEKVDIIIEILNKPVRVCGIVKDENSKGGKPFWVYDGKSESVQIVEESLKLTLMMKIKKGHKYQLLLQPSRNGLLLKRFYW